MATSESKTAIAASGKSAISTFRYTKDYCLVTLKNGVQGILGKTTDCPLGVMLSLKGQGIEIAYKKADPKQGDVLERYWLSWSME